MEGSGVASNESVARLAYDESLRAIEIQRAALDGLRTRAGTLLAAASLVTSFLGGQTLSQLGHFTPWAVTAVFAFILAAAASVWVLVPHKLTWYFDSDSLVEQYVDDPQMNSATALRDFALHHAAARATNDTQMKWLQRVFCAAAIILGIEVVAWLLALRGGLF